MFIGGVTFAEVGALRFLSTRPELKSDFVIETTMLESGSAILDDVVSEGIAIKSSST